MVSLQHLHFSYNKAVPILEDVNLELHSGRIYGLLGKNGAGKSSLMYNICGLLFPVSGRCTVLGQTPARREPAFLQQVCLLPEYFTMPAMSINEYLSLYAPF